MFVCETWERALQNAALADKLMTGAVGHSGTPPQDWYYAGRDHIFFMCRDRHLLRLTAGARAAPWPPKLRDALGPRGPPSADDRCRLLPPPMVEARKRKPADRP